jgi:hypothetical protein
VATQGGNRGSGTPRKPKPTAVTNLIDTMAVVADLPRRGCDVRKSRDGYGVHRTAARRRGGFRRCRYGSTTALVGRTAGGCRAMYVIRCIQV